MNNRGNKNLKENYFLKDLTKIFSLKEKNQSLKSQILILQIKMYKAETTCRTSLAKASAAISTVMGRVTKDMHGEKHTPASADA